jgi:UDP-2-acetamido-2,6-beta-L-arabino-hexul-4-ose reductase
VNLQKPRTELTRVLITGGSGFIGKNLQLRLAGMSNIEVSLFTRQSKSNQLPKLLQDADIVFHLAGVNRPEGIAEFQADNADLSFEVARVLGRLAIESGRQVPVVYASSIQAAQDNPYGVSKRAAERALFRLAEEHVVPVYVLRLPNVFGKWARPEYNSVVATFCHNIARDLPIRIDDPAATLKLVYIDDVIEQFLAIIEARILVPSPGDFVPIATEYQTTVGALAEQLRVFRESRNSLMPGRVGAGLVRALYATYVSYLPASDFSYCVPRHIDSRGAFVEVLKTPDAGQFSFFTANPGATRGGHYHHSKTEKFLVIAGNAMFRFRHMQTGEEHAISTSGVVPEVVETVPGWTHDITNIGAGEMIVMLWANEVFDPEKPDTFKCSLEQGIRVTNK